MLVGGGVSVRYGLFFMRFCFGTASVRGLGKLQHSFVSSRNDKCDNRRLTDRDSELRPYSSKLFIPTKLPFSPTERVEHKLSTKNEPKE